ncbi:MAG: response regulator, partial [Deltaproteobacteria bacterium]
MNQKKILIADKEKEFALSLAAVLSEEGCQFNFVIDGREVVQEAKEQRPQVIILRAEMPEVSGYTLCTQLRKSRKLKGSRILLMTSDDGEEAIERHRKGKYPADDYLQMPFDMDEFKQKVKNLLGGENGEETAAEAADEDATVPVMEAQVGQER